MNDDIDIRQEAYQLINDYKEKYHTTTNTVARKCCIRYDRMLDIENGLTIPKHSELIKLKKLNQGFCEYKGRKKWM